MASLPGANRLGLRGQCFDRDVVGLRRGRALGRPRRCKLAHAFLWGYSSQRLELAQLLGQAGAFLTSGSGSGSGSAAAPPPPPAQKKLAGDARSLARTYGCIQ
jgi:hypothetical protein